MWVCVGGRKERGGCGAAWVGGNKLWFIIIPCNHTGKSVTEKKPCKL